MMALWPCAMPVMWPCLGVFFFLAILGPQYARASQRSLLDLVEDAVSTALCFSLSLRLQTNSRCENSSLGFFSN